MAIYTPRGLKIRIGIAHAFALMSRLYPKVDAFKVLKTTEGLESIPDMLAFIVGIITFWLEIDPYQIGLYTFIASVVGTVIVISGIFIVPCLPRLGTFYSYISGFGILLVLLAIFGFITVGWQGVIAFFVGKLLAEVINNAIDFWNCKRINSKTGLTLTSSEISFFNAYRIHASAIGKTTDIIISDEELKEENWKECLIDLALKWPKVVKRFTNDEYYADI
jgi:hypothetical protein